MASFGLWKWRLSFGHMYPEHPTHVGLFLRVNIRYPFRTGLNAWWFRLLSSGQDVLEFITFISFASQRWDTNKRKHVQIFLSYGVSGFDVFGMREQIFTFSFSPNKVWLRTNKAKHSYRGKDERWWAAFCGISNSWKKFVGTNLGVIWLAKNAFRFSVCYHGIDLFGDEFQKCWTVFSR